MNDAKFLGLCIMFAAVIISASIIWSAQANQDALEHFSLVGSGAPSASGAPAAATVTIQGPVTLSPSSSPIPVTISTSEASPLTVKNVSEKKWTR